jgi:hypothetical protein
MTYRDALLRTSATPKPCDLCGELTNTPGACFECFHKPYGAGWELEQEERFAWLGGADYLDGRRL